MNAAPLRRVALVLVLALVAAGCAQPGEGGYRVSATFPRATALFEESRVQVMGVDVGHVETLEIDGDRIRAELRIDRDVPLPEDVGAAIVPLTVIGERNVVLHPSFEPGDERIEDGHEIPPDRTSVAAEPDEVLETVEEITTTVDAERTAEVADELAGALEGRGQELRAGIEDGARIARVLREQHQSFLAAGESLTELADIVGDHEEQLLSVSESYVEATSVLAAERRQIRPLLDNVEGLMDEGGALLAVFEETLPEDLATLAEASLVLQANTGGVQQLVTALPEIADMLIEAHRPDTEALKLRFSISVTLRTLLNQLLTLIGLAEVDCLPLPDIEC